MDLIPSPWKPPLAHSCVPKASGPALTTEGHMYWNHRGTGLPQPAGTWLPSQPSPMGQLPGKGGLLDFCKGLWVEARMRFKLFTRNSTATA